MNIHCMAAVDCGLESNGSPITGLHPLMHRGLILKVIMILTVERLITDIPSDSQWQIIILHAYFLIE